MTEKAKCKNCTNEMIEEMAKVMCGNDCEECAKETAQWRGCSLKKAKAEECLIKKEAKLLYNANYRKIPKGSLVLDRQEHQKYCAYKIIEPQIKGCLDRERELEKQVAELEEQRDRQAYITEHLKDCIESNQVVEKITRKETAKEILQSLLDFVNCEKINQGHSFEKIKEALIKVAKAYEVEVEE